jgi:predicted O-linked N-acetylglucosamine transferase (SPINDLY family)
VSAPSSACLLETATEHHRTGDLAEARRLYGEVLRAEPGHDLALFRFGLLELQEGRHEAAATMIRAAAERVPGNIRYQLGLGQALQSLGRWPEAAAALRRVLELDPDFFDAQLDLGVSLQRMGDPALAAAAYRAALARRPDDPRALGNLGAVLREMGELDEATRLLEEAARLEPDAASHAINLGILHCQRRDFAAADSILRAVLAREPDNAEAAFNLGNAVRGLGRPHEAIEHYRWAAARRPGHAEALNNLGNAYKETGDFAAAMAAFGAALAARPDYTAAINNAGCLLRTLGRLDEAEDMLRRGLALDPRHPALHDNLANVLKDAGALDEAISHYRQALDLDPSNAATHGNLAYALSFQCAGPEPILEECLRWGARFAAPLERSHVAPARDLSPDRRLRVGYVSGDFREHCQSLFTLPLFAHHDRREVEVVCYSSVERRDDWTRCLESCADVWRDARTLDDAALAELVRQDRIDILVDLNMHMAHGRPLLFARKPAPLQIAWLAYPGTTGMTAIDYRLSDPRLDPEEFDRHYSERTLRLADTFWCYDPQSEHIGVNELPAMKRGHVTLGCFNNPCKLTDRTLDLWGGVMRAIPDAHLRLMAPPGRHRERLLARLGAYGVAAHRLSFVEFRPREDYLQFYHDVDFGLDTLPYNGHTTSLDAFWMGVPIVTRLGDTCVGRAGLSQLFHLDLLDLVADSDTDFVAIAAALAADVARLRTLRGSLRETMQRSPLMDAARFAHCIEHAYRDAWRALPRRAALSLSAAEMNTRS